MITKYIVGDITQTELKYIAHGVNCQDKMGSGVAKALFTKFPEVKTEYHRLFKQRYEAEHGEYGPLLGTIQEIKLPQITVFNMFTQNQYGYDGTRYVNYGAIVDCFRELHDDIVIYKMLAKDHRVAIPKIGCGLAGGNWEFMEQLINDTVGDSLEIWVYELEEKKYSKQNGDIG